MSFDAIRNDDDGYFNDLSRQPRLETQDSVSPQDQNSTDAVGEDAGMAKSKRIACVICRKRKLKCDGNKPKCATCARLGHNCAYDEVRRKSGPKRGYVKDLEARLAQVEGKLKTQGNKKSEKANESIRQAIPEDVFELGGSMGMQGAMQQSILGGPYDSMPTNDNIMLPNANMAPIMMPDQEYVPQIDLNLDQSFSWEMIGLGLEEPMPSQEAVDELTELYFEKIHPSLPFIHKYRYHASMNLAPDRRPPICLRYIMWCHAASITDKYMHHQDIFYRRARKYIELDEMKGIGEAFVSLAHAQTWTLICTYEFKTMCFPRAWMSVGRAARMATMMGLNQVDNVGGDAKQCLPPPKDWTETEERRRTFWMAYCCDRFASIGTGWPMMIDERDIKTFLPVSEEAYASGTVQTAPMLDEAMKPQQAAQLSAFGGMVLTTHFFGLNILHIHRPEPNQQEHDVNGQFWKRHRAMDNDLLKTALQLPSSLRLPAGIRNPNVVFLNFALHTSTICHHQAAITKAENYNLPRTVIEQSRTRCILAAAEIAGVMRLASHLDVAGMNPFIAFCLYVAARVFVGYLKKRPDDQEAGQSLEFLLTAMHAIQRKNPLAQSFLVQLNADVAGNGLVNFLQNPDFSPRWVQGLDPNKLPKDPNKAPGRCSPIFQISETSEDGQSPKETRAPVPGDHIFLRQDPRKEIPLPPTENRAQQTYAFRNADVNHHVPQKDSQNKADASPRQFDKIFSNNDWNQGNIATMAGLNTFTDMDNMTAINVNNQHLDAEMTDHSSSRGPTPLSNSSNYQSSSNTSYSPSQGHDDDQTASGNDGGINYMTGSAPLTRSTTYTGESVKQGMSNSAQQQEDPFKIPASWEAGTGMTGTGLTPGSLSSMTSDVGWEKIMDSMGWETGRSG